MMQNLLIVDDDARISELLVRFLRGQDFDISSASDGTVAIDHILREEPDLVILDLMLPEMSGIEVCKRIRPHYQNPIIMLTAHDNEISEVEALNAGIDDYLAKPVRPHVLLARINALLRRTVPPSQLNKESGPLEVQDLNLYPDSRTVMRAGRVVELSDSEFDLLWLLASHAGSVVSRDQLSSGLRGVAFDGLDRSVDMRVSKLRKSLGDGPVPHRYIRTMRSKGYLFLKESS